MKHLLILILLISNYVNAQVIWNEDTTDNNLVNVYGEELKRLRIKHKNNRIMGFIKSVNIVNGSLMESVIVNYKDKDGESMQDLVSTRIISYKEVPKKDTAAAFKKDSIEITSVKEIKSFDSITFESTKITKFNQGYLVVGDINDGGVKIPIALSNFNLRDTIKKPQLPQWKRFSRYGTTLFESGKAIGSVFSPIAGDSVVLLKLFIGTPDNWTGQITDKCYISQYEIPVKWWYNERHKLTWEEQFKFIEENYAW